MNLALFDLDHTLLPIDSDYAWGEFTIAIGWRDAAQFKRANDAFYADYKAGTLDPHAYLRFATEAIRLKGATQSIAAHVQYMRTIIEKHIQKPALDLVERHRAAGDTLVLVTATNEFVTRPIAQRLGFAHLIAVELEKGADNWYTGASKGVLSFREGKVTRVEQWLAAQGKTWDDVRSSTFYSDSMNDLPLLEKVHTPVATNPDDKLRALATQRGWQILDLWKHD
ncbi:MAG: HAD family hydrolase [Burkholderiaceae bacterium]